MASELKPSSLDFGVVIAFVAPGFVAFKAASYHMPTARAWMDAASNKEQSVGVFLFVLLASLSMGLVVSGVRALAIDNLLRSPRILGRFVVPQITFDWAQVDDKKLSILLTLRDSYFRHYQFYSNTLVALVFWTFSRAFATGPSLPWQQWALIGTGIIALLLSARDSFLRYSDSVNRALRNPNEEDA
jgi:hypothetical protein